MRPSKTIYALLPLACAALALAQPPTPRLPAAPAGSASEAQFERTIRPILVAKCIECHGPRNAQSNLRLDTADGAAKAVVAGDPVASPLIRAIRYEGPHKMPPSGPLPADQVRAITAWVAQGAHWPKSAAVPSNQPHWAFQRVLKPKVPTIPGSKSPIDAFVRQRLAKVGLVAAPSADRRTLIRRASFDLTGLPPAPDDVDRFLADRSPDAWEKVVDRLLGSPAFGERWGRHWLDVARYADSNGLDENLAHGNAWRYRDWVVRAHNQDVPYDRFVQFQVAGELVPTRNDDERADAITATGFLTLGPKVLAEQDKPKLVMDIVDEQIDVLSKSVLGVTIACARCHDHKFDPISTKDYYALAGIFKSTKSMANLDFVSRWNERPLEGAGFGGAREKYDRETLAPLRAAVDAARKAVSDSAAAGGLFVEATAYVSGNLGKDNYGKGSVNSNGTPSKAVWEIDVPVAGHYRLKARYAAEESRPTRLRVNGATVSENAASEPTGGWQLDHQRWTDVGAVVLSPGKVRIELHRDGAIPHFSRFLLLADGATSPIAADEALQKAETALRKAEAERPKAPTVMAVEEGKPEDVRVHVRGDTQTLGDVAPRGFPSALCNGKFQPLPTKEGSGRLDLARWLTRPDNPLTARVAVNRIWMHLIGQPLVNTVDNWGIRGEKPSHPELLDWLASTFANDDQWSRKKLIRRILLSETYRQTAIRRDPDAERKDPENRLMWRANRRRLEAEPLRDSLHFVAGTLDPTIGGTLLSTPNGDYVTNDQSGNAAQYEAPRRAIYLPVIRNAVYDWFQAFDFGDPSMVNARRSSTTVAPQALYLINSPMVREQARAFARRVLRERPDSDDPARVEYAYRLALQRSPFPAEADRALRFLARVRGTDSRGVAAAVLRDETWAALCQVLLASNEFVYVD